MSIWHDLSELLRVPRAAMEALPAGLKDSEIVRTLHSQNHITQFQSRYLLAGKAKQLAVGDYLLVDKLGQGGMGEVFLARRRDASQRPCVLKSVCGGDPARQAREARLLMTIRHPCVIHAFDYFYTASDNFSERRAWLAMDWLPGPDLYRWVQRFGAAGRDPSRSRQAVWFVRQAARGLAAAHEAGIVHRDVKPANLILDEHGCVQLADFGIAGREGGDNTFQMTATGQLLGTTDFMAPEQAQDAKNVDRRADVYSLGCTLYFLLEGQSPFQADDPVSMIVQHVEAPLPILTQARKAPNGRWLEQFIHRLMAKDPALRPDSCSDIAEQLKSYLSGRVAFQRANRRRWVGATSAVLASGITTYAAWPQNNPLDDMQELLREQAAKSPQAQAAEVRSLSAGILPETNRLASGESWQLYVAFPAFTHRFEVSHDGKLCANLEWERLRIIDVATQKTVAWFEFEPAAVEIDWTHDNRGIIAVLQDGSVKHCDLNTRQLGSLFAFVPKERFELLSCHPYLPLLALSLANGGWMAVPLDTKQLATDDSIQSFPSARLSSLAWAPLDASLLGGVNEEGLHWWKPLQKESQFEKSAWELYRRIDFGSPVDAVGWRVAPDTQMEPVPTVCLRNRQVWQVDNEGGLPEAPLIENAFDANHQLRWSANGESLFATGALGSYFARRRFTLEKTSRAGVSASDERLVTGSTVFPDRGIDLYDSANRLIAHLGWPIPRDDRGTWPDQIAGCTSICWAQEGKSLLVCSPHGGLHGFDVSGRRRKLACGTMDGHSFIVRPVDASQVVVLDWRATLMLVNLRSGHSRVLNANRREWHEQFLNRDGLAVRGSPLGAVIVGDGNGNNVWFADLVTWRIWHIEYGTEQVAKAAVSKTDNTMFCSLVGNKVEQRDLMGQPLRTWQFPDKKYFPRSLQFAPDSDMPSLICDGAVWRLQDDGNMSKQFDLVGESIAWHSTCDLVASATAHQIFIYDRRGNLLQEIVCATHPQSGLCWHPSEALLAMILREGVVAVYDFAAGAFRWSMLPLGPNDTLTLDPKGRILDGKPSCLDSCIAVISDSSENNWRLMTAGSFLHQDSRLT